MRKVLIVCIASFIMVIPVVRGGLFDPAILNPSFESPDLGAGGANAFEYYADDWVLSIETWGYLEDGTWFPSADGVNTFKLWASAYLWQQIGTWDEGLPYEITVAVGMWDADTGATISLWAGGDAGDTPDQYGEISVVGATEVDSAFVQPSVAVSESEDMTVVLNTGTGFNAGDPLWIRIDASAGAATYVDNVRVVLAVIDFAILVAPGNGEINVPVDTILEWDPTPDHELSSKGYEVFFGAEPNELNPNYDLGSPVYSGLNESFDPDKPGTAEADLEWNTTYYWHVDYFEPNSLGGGDIRWVGPLWSFTTAPPTPIVIEDPANTTVAAGSDAFLSVETRNPERYDWYKVGSPDQLIASHDSTALTDTLTISGTQQGNEGRYYCRVINGAAPGGVDSSTALVMTERLVARWEFEDNLDDTNPYPTKWGGSIVDPDTGNAVAPNVSFVTGGDEIQGNYAVHINNLTGEGEGYVLIDGSEGAFDFYRDGLTVSVWIKRVDFPEPLDWWDRIINYAGFNMQSVYPNNWLWGEVEGAGFVWIGAGVDEGGWRLETMTFDGGTMRGYLNGKYVGEISGVPTVGAQLPLTIGGMGLGSRITATLDDIQVYSYPLSSVDVAKLYTDEASGTVCVEDDGSLPSLQWDLNGNCRIDIADIAEIVADWLNCREVPTCL